MKAGRIIALADDLAITMRATSLRAAPIPGRGAVGVEIPNPSPRMVTLRELLESDACRTSPAMLPVALGRDVGGKVRGIRDVPKAALPLPSNRSGRETCNASL